MTKVLALAAVSLAVTAGGGSAAGPAGAPISGVVPHFAPFHSFALPAAASPTDVSLQEDPCGLTSTPFPCWTMPTNTTYAIYWVPSGSSVQAGYTISIDRFLGDVAAASGRTDNVYSVATQYYDNVAAIHYQSTFGGSYLDTHPFPASGCSAKAVCLTDAQLQTEVQRVITAKGWQAGPNALFVILTPDGVASCYDGSTQQCSTNYYCAYHSGFIGTNEEPVLYANEPYDATISGCASGPSPNGNDADAAINTISHEQNESITDPWGDAWLNAAGDEIADICAWQYGTPLGGAAGAEYNQVINGDHYALQEEYSNEGSACLQSYTPSLAPSTVAPPVLSGVAAPGKLLSTSDGSWAHAPSTYAYQWQRCSAAGTDCVDISGATASTYTPGAADLGFTIRSTVSAHNLVGDSPSYVSSGVSQVVVAPPASTGAPVLSGIPAVGKKLSTTAGSWNTQVTLAYQWLRCSAAGTGCAAIPGARLAVYKTVTADAGHTLEAQVTATNAAGSANAVSNRSATITGFPSSLRVPHISGPAKVGRKVTAGRGSWSGSPKTYRFQWLRCSRSGGSCARIAHATHPTYRLTTRDRAHRLRVRVTAVNVAGSRVATSRPTGLVPTGH